MVDHHHRRSSFFFFLSSLLFLLLSLDCLLLVATAKSQTRFDERLALLRLRSTLGLRGTDWPIKGDPCLVWRGIQCDLNGSVVVVGINISGFKRTRIGKRNPRFFSSLEPLANLTSLLYFNASGFALPGSLPDWFALTLTTLRVLDLTSCSLTGVVPVTLGNLTTLITLNLSRNGLTGLVPSSLGGLSSLNEIDLSKNSLTGPLPDSFTSLLNLTSLDVSGNYLTGPIPIGVGSLSKLLYLNLSSNSFSSSIPPQLGDLVNLVDLDLSVNSLSGSVPVEFRKLTNLKSLVVSDNLLSGALPDDLFGSGANNSQLESLVLRENGFFGYLPDACWSLPMLKNLDVAENNFTGTLPNSTTSSGDAGVVVVVVNISSNMFYGELTPILTRFSAVDLSGNYFEGQVPDYVVRANASVTRNCLRDEKRQKSSEDCSSFYTAKGLEFDAFGRPNITKPSSGKASKGISHMTVIILAAVGGGIGFILIVILVALCIRRRRRRGSGGVNNDRPTTKPVTEASQPPKGGQTFDLSRLGNAFAFEQLLQATEEFGDANLIKHGHSGSLFRGFLDNGTPVVIKKIDAKESKNEGYISAELQVFSKAGQHQRLVPFLGHCLESESQKVLVYKYMRNGDLASSLFRKSDNEGGDGLKSLDWITRLKIALGAAEGLAYLHHECSPPLVHRDVQASSILLDDKFDVRLGSLSEVYAQADVYQSRISRLLRLPQSTEASSSGAANATCSYDVYCFGKVLLELVTGKLGISSPDNAEAKAYMEEALKYISTNEKELVTKILDPSLLVDEDLLEEVWAMAIIAKSCLNPKPTRRPLMRHIVNALENPLKVVREDNNSGSGGSSRLRTNSSRGSWNAAIFGSWRQSASDVTGVHQAGGGGNGNSGSQGSSGRNNNNGNSSSRRRQSSEIVPEPPGYGEDV
ncbi:putative LRR receptor-like serine/threonine-protein kinase [Raphanus sativus]|uniref:Probable LRR receptor-like serine/threonine-protein kinase At2g16250 n=1 Tax=Raphanus sativus TaxID=3726 RepID=A0A6J0P9S3_RAPSA|nr:probable LRR receptor-like serine/threonine-protein kinase At2g16250 [Raphanus sativus]KAJ4897007.1 putative LRR receptor-like serine/threonine-protein kinase [Raphanus sativus]